MTFLESPTDTGFQVASSLVIKGDLMVVLERVELDASEPENVDVLAVAITAKNLVIENAIVTQRPATTAIAGGGIYMHDGGVLRVRDSQIIGSISADPQEVTFGINGEAEIIVTDSFVTGLSTPAASDPDDEALHFYFGISAQGDSVSLARSEVSSVSSPGYDFYFGAQFAVASETRRTVIHNSVIRTSLGGNVSINLTNNADDYELDLVYSTLIVGDDFEADEANPFFAGSNILPLGHASRIDLRNSVLSYAGGRGTVPSTFNMNNTPEAPFMMKVFNNVYSIPIDQLQNYQASWLFCFDSDVSIYRDRTSLNGVDGSTVAYGCYRPGYAFAEAYRARGNVLLDHHLNPPVPHTMPPSPGVIFCASDLECRDYDGVCLPAGGNCQVQSFPIAEFDLAGKWVCKPDLVKPCAIMNATGAPVTSADLGDYTVFPLDPLWNFDFDGVERTGAARRRIGARPTNCGGAPCL